MTLRELKNFISKLPEEMDEFDVVKCEVKLNDTDKTVIMYNNVILTIYVDEKNKEIQFNHQSEEEVKNMLLNENVF